MFEFIADRPVLDFVATVAERHSTRDDRLRSPDDLRTWIAESGIVDEPVAVDAAGLGHAVAVREAAFRLVTALIDGTRPDAEDLAVVHAAAAQPEIRLQVDGDGRLHRQGDLGAVLSALARDCLDLFGSPDRAALHWCADRECTRPFLDRSRGRRRRWCGMKGCGDRAKAAAYRQRRRQAQAG
ncbi:MAG: CGNR zinc finger domain-containing protein [Friedmanniella sp.]